MPLRVLIVENEDLVALDLSDIVEEAGHTVVGRAANQNDALTLAKKHRPDVAMVDIDLDEGNNGLDVAVALTKRFGTHALFLTARCDFYVRAMSMDAEPLAYITKPYKADEVLAALARA